MSDGGLSDKKLIIYVSSSMALAPREGWAAAASSLQQPQSFIAQIINDQRMNDSVIRSRLPALFISLICINCEVRV